MIEEKDQVEQSNQQAMEALSQPEPEQPQQEAASPKPSEDSPNFKRLREEKARLEREKEELLRMMAQINNPRPAQAPEEPAPSYNPDDLVEWKVVNKEINKIRNEFNQYKQQSHETMVEAQLRSRYQDFEKVVSKENLDALKDQEPELYNTIYSSSDLYSKAASAYKMIKQMGIYKDDYTADKQRAHHNATKPKPAAVVQPSVGSTALGEAASHSLKLTPELKKKYQEELMKSSKSHYFG